MLQKPKPHRSAKKKMLVQPAAHAAPRLLPLGALAAGFGMLGAPAAFAQTTPSPAAAASAPNTETTLAPIGVKAKIETDANSVRATTSTIGKGNQELRDIPQSVTVITERLIKDRRIDTLKEALHQTAGVTFLAAEGGEEDIRLRGFSLAASGDIYVDSLRDPAFYERDTFSFDRIELLRGSASMLFGRGSTGGVVNQVSKMPFLANANEVSFTIGDGSYLRLTGDFNVKASETSAVRVNVMTTNASGGGGNDKLDKQGLAPSFRWGIGTNDEFYVSGYYLRNNNGINYGLPWLRASSTQTSANPSGIIEGLDPSNYYGAASDYNKGGAALATAGWTHRFADGGELKSAIRQGRYDRDQRAGTIRFYTNTNPANGPIVLTPGASGPTLVTDSTLLTRGAQNKIQNMTTTYAQSDYSNKFNWFGVKNEVLTGVDLAHEEFKGFAAVLPTGVVLDKNTPRTTIGTPDDGTGFVDESRRIVRQQAAFDAKSVGVYVQDLVQITPTWKLLGGLRWDYFKGSYQTFQTATTGTNPPPLGTVTADRGRSDSLFSHRLGALYQPTDTMSFHFSYGTSFNTSGDTYQYDLPGSNTDPEGSRNFELGAKLDLFEGKMSTRVALFHSTKFNERNRDSPDGTPLTDYVLSGKRHTAGVELDLAGRITSAWEVFGSYAWIPVAKIDKGPPSGVALSGELVGDRPSLTPRHSGTIWTTYQFTPSLRLGGGLNARSSQTPNRNPAGVVAPSFVTGDLLAEYTLNESIGFKLNVNNVTNKLYADSLYTGHYIPGLGRKVQLTMTARF